MTVIPYCTDSMIIGEYFKLQKQWAH